MRDLHKAVAALWGSSGLDAVFEAYWAVADRGSFEPLNEGAAAPGTPLPYAVFQSSKPTVRVRMSAGGSRKLYVTDCPWQFTVYAEKSGSSSAKEVASLLVEEILKVFGGHPTSGPTGLTLDNGSVLIVQYQDDYCERIDEDVYQWTVSYNFRTDVPVMV